MEVKEQELQLVLLVDCCPGHLSWEQVEEAKALLKLQKEEEEEQDQ